MSQGPMSSSPSKGGVMRNQMPSSYQPPFGGQMPMQQPSYQAPFGNQNYRTQTSPSKGGSPSFGGPAYQQPGQFGGQVMNRPMQSPGSKGGYSAPMMQQPMRSPGMKGGQTRPPVQAQPYPMPSPGGKGRSYQPPPTPYGYGQTLFSPGQFSGYGRPSNMFSFETPHYQPYVPPQYEMQPYRGTDPRPTAPPLQESPNVNTIPAEEPTRTINPPLAPDATQTQAAAQSLWSQAQAAMDSGSLAGANKFLAEYENITGNREPMYGLQALDPSRYYASRN